MHSIKDPDMKLHRREGKHPAWWTDQHTSAWDRVKEALLRDWEQTKSDLTGNKSGRDLDQDVGDTIKQALGKEPIPPLSQQNIPDDPKAASKRIEDLNKTSEKAAQRIVNAEVDLHETEEKMSREIAGAEAKLGEKIADASQDVTEARLKANEKIADARQDLSKDPEKARETMAKQQENIFEARRKAAEKMAKAEEKTSEKIEDAREKAGENAMKAREKMTEAQIIEMRAKQDRDEVEAAMRYGYSVRSQYPGATWDDDLETKLRAEWISLNDRSWDESRPHIQRGWNLAAKK